MLIVLRVRAIILSDAARERLLAEKDRARLERWLERAAASIDDVFDQRS